MNTYYVTGIKRDLWGSGVRKKIDQHMKLLKEFFGDNQYIYLRRDNKFLANLFGLLLLTSEYKTNKLDSICKGSIVYIRYIRLDIQLLYALHKLSKRALLVMEIPTYPYDGEYNSFFDKFKLLQDKILRNYLRRYVKRIVTYSSDDNIFGIPTIRISNAIDVEKEIKFDKYTGCTEDINMIAVANFGFWHGYDRIINGLADYYNSDGDRKVFLHIVGTGEKIIKEYKEIVSKYGIEKYVLFYGERNNEELDRVYNKCLIGIDALGRHRAGVYYNSTLKGKEYLLHGLMVVSGVKTELDQDGNFEYYLRFPADESIIDINKIIEFYDEKIQHKNIHDIKNYIHDYAVANYSYRKTFEPVIDYLKNI